MGTFIDHWSIEENLQAMWKVAKKRQDLVQLEWHFEGDIKDYRSPNLLSTFLRWVLTGPLKVDILVSKISLLVLERTFEKTIENILGFSTIENSLSIGIGSYLSIHKKQEVDKLSPRP